MSRLMRYFFQLCIFACTATAIPLHNITLPLPLGTSNHGTPGLLCTPTKWTDVILFYLFNYVAHAATVLTKPGERSDDFLASIIGSLLFPALGLYRGIEAILSGAVFVRNDALRKAARSGALCVVVRGKDWRPVAGDEVGNAIFRRAKREACVMRDENVIEWLSAKCKDACDRSLHVITYSPPWLKSQFRTPVYVQRQIVHGTYRLPEGYRIAIVPSDAQFTALASRNVVLEVSATHNLVKALIALVQSGYALSTLYRSRGDQIELFGYAAFGLTVAPYAVMSIMNLIGNLCRPDYASLYFVENSIMDEARRRGGMFEGAVGRLFEEKKPVCGCGLVDSDDVERLRFSTAVSGDLLAEFATAAPPEIYTHLSEDSTRLSENEKSASVCSVPTLHSHTIKPLPTKLNYVGTDDDAILLVPCCNPIARGQSHRPSSPPDIPSMYRLSTLSLSKACPPFKHRDWIAKFAPNLVPPHPLHWQITKYAVTTLIALTPLIIYGAMSRFQSGSIPLSESSTWKAYTMQWLILGAFCGIWWVVDQENKDARPSHGWQFSPMVRTLMYVISASPAVATVNAEVGGERCEVEN
ncbi:hypothetical protein N0V90_002227 [Kalmusia sp. IMI 367209]|nr:hypothetical protein N0V90_002227 [Kalmusia sp. IMI 367209]